MNHRKLIIRDMRAQQATPPEPPPHRSEWRLPTGLVGALILVAFFAAWVVAMLVLGTGCSPTPCVPTRPAAIVAECRAQYRQAGCADDPERKCPQLVSACDRRIDELTDAEVCAR